MCRVIFFKDKFLGYFSKYFLFDGSSIPLSWLITWTFFRIFFISTSTQISACLNGLATVTITFPIFKPTIRQLLRLCAQNTPPPGQSREEKKFLFHI